MKKLPASGGGGCAVRGVIPAVVSQHIDDVCGLYATRAVAVRAPNVTLRTLARIDERLAASLDGIAVAGDAGRALVMETLADVTESAVFVAAVGALDRRDTPALDKLLALGVPAARAGVPAAFGWVSGRLLEGLPQLRAADPARRALALRVYALHMVDPGQVLSDALMSEAILSDATLTGAAGDPAAAPVAAAVAGEAGRRDLLPACLAILEDENPAGHHAAARAAVLLGDRDAAVQRLCAIAQGAGPDRTAALMLVLKVLEPPAAQALLTALAQGGAAARDIIRGAGVAGDPLYVPWLIRQMHDVALSRCAGEAVALITGLDLALLDLDRKPPEGIEPGPDDDPANDDVALDEDESLPWPDPARITAWWDAHGHDYPRGVRCFMGAPPTVEHCRHVLRDGYQRQRSAAAEYLCLLQPGTKLFQTAAPAWRQQRWLKRLG